MTKRAAADRRSDRAELEKLMSADMRAITRRPWITVAAVLTFVVGAAGRASAVEPDWAEGEWIGGFDVLDVPDVDRAVELAAHHPGADGGRVEVRASWPFDEEA